MWVYLVGDIESLRGVDLVTVEADGQLPAEGTTLSGDRKSKVVSRRPVHVDIVLVAVQLEVYEPQHHLVVLHTEVGKKLFYLFYLSKSINTAT